MVQFNRFCQLQEWSPKQTKQNTKEKQANKRQTRTAKPNQQTHKAKNILRFRVQFHRFCQLQEWSQKQTKQNTKENTSQQKTNPEQQSQTIKHTEQKTF